MGNRSESGSPRLRASSGTPSCSVFCCGGNVFVSFASDAPLGVMFPCDDYGRVDLPGINQVVGTASRCVRAACVAEGLRLSVSRLYCHRPGSVGCRCDAFAARSFQTGLACLRRCKWCVGAFAARRSSDRSSGRGRCKGSSERSAFTIGFWAPGDRCRYLRVGNGNAPRSGCGRRHMLYRAPVPGKWGRPWAFLGQGPEAWRAHRLRAHAELRNAGRCQ